MSQASNPLVILITSAATGIGQLSARSLAQAGYTVYASMRHITTRNAARAQAERDYAQSHGVDLHVVELDVTSQESANQAVQTVLAEQGHIDIVLHNAGHLVIGYVEAFQAEEIDSLFQTNVLGVARVNRAILPHLRERGAGLLLYTGSTTSVVVPPFMGPYVTSKMAMDALAQTTAYEVSQFGIETCIVMPGPFTQGTSHFPDATRPADCATTAAYARLDSMVARNEEATSSFVVTLLAYGCPVQAIVQAFGLDERTIGAWRDRAGRQCQKVHEKIIEQGKLDLIHVQADEIRVKGRSQVIWMGLATMVSTRLWLAGVGSPTRDRQLADQLLQQVRRCACGVRALPVATDGWAA